MTHYLNVFDGQIIDYDINYKDLIKQIPVSEEILLMWQEDNRKVIYQDGQIIVNPNYEQELQNEIRQNKINQLHEQIEILDKKRIRAICEPSIRDAETGETWLDYYNKQIQDLREQIKNLGG